MKKLLVLCSMGIMAMSIASCDGKETKINYQEGNDILNAAADQTIANIKEVANGDYIGFGVEGNGNVAINLEYVDASNITESMPLLHKVGLAVDADAKLKCNLNTAELDQTPADFSNFESYRSYTANSTIKLDESETKTSASEIVYHKNNIIKTKEEGKDVVVEECTPLELAPIAEDILDIVDEIKNLQSNTPIIAVPSISVDPSVIENLSTKWNDFTTGKITSAELIDYVNSVAGQDIFESAEPGVKDCVICILNIAKDADPSKYFNYTKTTSKNSTTLSSSFAYSQWKTDLLAGFDKEIAAIKVPTSPVGVMLTSIKMMVDGFLPTSFKMDYTLNLNKQNVVTGFAVDFNIAGSIPTYMLSTIVSLINLKVNLIPDDISLETSMVNYDISASASMLAEFGNQAVVIPTL